MGDVFRGFAAHPLSSGGDRTGEAILLRVRVFDGLARFGCRGGGRRGGPGAARGGYRGRDGTAGGTSERTVRPLARHRRLAVFPSVPAPADLAGVPAAPGEPVGALRGMGNRVPNAFAGRVARPGGDAPASARL